MPLNPPPVAEAEFVAVNTTDEDEIKRRFAVFVRRLHDYLNQVPCLRDIQQTRRRWKAKVANAESFGTFATAPRHWYSYHHGGRNEAQFNLGLFTTHFRVGFGFEFSEKKGGDPTVVQLVYACFVNWIRINRQQFENLVLENGLEVEWHDKGGGPLQFVATASVVEWLLDPPREPMWIFVGRLLRREKDAAELSDSVQLGAVIETVLCGFRPIWEAVQVMAKMP